MSRLTDYKGHYCFLSCDETRGEDIKAKCNIYNQCLERKVYDKLCHYEDLEEQGRLIELPCKVGDTVYRLWYTECHNGVTYPDLYDCRGCEDECDIELTVVEQKVRSMDWLLSSLTHFGSEYFTAKEEAEAKLKELKEGAKE